MAPKSALVKLRRHILKRLLEGDRSNSPKFMGFGESVFKLALNASAPEIHHPKKQERKRLAKEKKIIQIDLEDSPTLGGKSEINVLAKDFPYSEFMDKELMTLAYLEQLQDDDNGLAEKF